MKKVIIALLIGIVVGIIDVVPMLVQELNLYACLSAFVHWVVLGVLIPYVAWNIKPWAKGLIIAELTALPIIIIVFEKEPTSIIPMLVFSALLGVLVGIAGSRFIKKAED